MAKIIRVGEPCPNEIAPIGFLRDRLPDDYTVIHNIELLVNQTWKEVDAVIVTPHLVFLVDFKWWGGETKALSTSRVAQTDHGMKFTMANRWITEWGEEKESPLPKLRQNARVLRGEFPDSCRQVHVSPLVILTARDSSFTDNSGKDGEFVKTLEDAVRELRRRDVPPNWAERDYDLTPKQHEDIIKTINGADAKAFRERKTPRNFGRWVVLAPHPSPSSGKGECLDFVVHDSLVHETANLFECLDWETMAKALKTRELELILEKSGKGKKLTAKNPKKLRELMLKELSGKDLAHGLATVVQGGRGVAKILGVDQLHRIAERFPLHRLTLHETLMYLEPKPRGGTRAKLANAYRALAELPPHENIVRASDASFTEDEDAFILVLDDPGLDGAELPREMEQRLCAVRGLLAGLAHAHAHNVIHRNLSRDALVIGPGGSVKLTGFDYARSRGHERTHTFAASLHELVHSDYAAPELLPGGEGCTSASDVYSAGILIHEILTGKRPFASPGEALEGGGFPVAPSTLIDSLPEHVDGARLDAWLQSLCLPEVTERPSAALALDELEALLAPPAASPAPAPAGEMPPEEEAPREEQEPAPDFGNLPPGFSFTPELTVVDRLGKPGAFGVVYRMTHHLAGLDRAVKLVLLGERGQAIERVRREYKALLGLQDQPHKHIVRVFGAHTIPETVPPYVVFELVPGDTLQELFSRRGLTDRAVWRLGIEAADALHHLHSLGIYHRDIKPGNLIWLPEGGVRIIDFNIAAGIPGLQQERAGTPRYTPPDFSIATENPSAGDLADLDVYALALVLYEGWTGQYPWPGCDSPPPGTPARQPGESGEYPGLLPDGPAAALLREALSPRRADRFPSAREFRDRLIDAAPGDLRDLGVDCGLDPASFSRTVILPPGVELAPPPEDVERDSAEEPAVAAGPFRPRGTSIVLAVGINEYGAGWSQAECLEFAERDAIGLVETLREHFGFRGRALTGREATRAAIFALLKEYEGKLAPEDQMLFAFFGHGESIGRDSYILHPVDGIKGDDSNSISLSAIETRMALSGSCNLAQIYDSCRTLIRPGVRGADSGAVSRERVVKACRRADAAPNQIFEIAFSTAWGETAREYPDLEHGAFTKFFLETLMERKGRKGLTFRECIAATADRMRQWTPPAPPGGRAWQARAQLPEYLSHPVTEDVFFIAPGVPAGSSAGPPASDRPVATGAPETPTTPGRTLLLPRALAVLGLVMLIGAGWVYFRGVFHSPPDVTVVENGDVIVDDQTPEDGSFQVATGGTGDRRAFPFIDETPTPTPEPTATAEPTREGGERERTTVAAGGLTVAPGLATREAGERERTPAATERPTPTRPVQTATATPPPLTPTPAPTATAEPIREAGERERIPAATERPTPTRPVQTATATPPPPTPTPEPTATADDPEELERDPFAAALRDAPPPLAIPGRSGTWEHQGLGAVVGALTSVTNRMTRPQTAWQAEESIGPEELEPAETPPASPTAPPGPAASPSPSPSVSLTPTPLPTPVPNSLAIPPIRVEESLRRSVRSTDGEPAARALDAAARRIDSRVRAALDGANLFEIGSGDRAGGPAHSPATRYTLTLRMDYFEDRTTVISNEREVVIGARRDLALGVSALIRDEVGGTAWTIGPAEARERLSREAFSGIVPDLSTRTDILIRATDHVVEQLNDAIQARFQTLPLDE